MGTGSTLAATDAGARLTGQTLGPFAAGSSLWYWVPPSGGDDTNAINNAIAAASLTRGVVALSGAYTVSTLLIKSAVTIFAIGTASVTQFSDSANALQSIITIVGPVQGVVIDGLQLSGSILAGHEADDNICCIFFSGVGQIGDCVVRNCTLVGKSCAIGTNMIGNGGFNFRNLLLDHNTTVNLQYGIRIGPYTQNAVVNNGITIERNTCRVTATGGYSGFYFARPLTVINTNNFVIRNNFSIGGFSGIEVYGGTGLTSPRPRMTVGHIDNNTTDGHIGFTQVTDGTCTNNIVDLTLRDPSWPKYDDATVLANWGYLPGIESCDNTNCVTSGNTVSNQVGTGILFGLVESCTLASNTIVGTGVTATPPAYAHGIWIQYNSLTGSNINSSIIGNVLENCARSGIAQTDTAAPDFFTDFTINDNKIYSCQEHGIHIRNFTRVKVCGNTIRNPNMVAGAFNGIDCTRPFPGTDLIRNFTVENNTIQGSGIAAGTPAVGIFNNYYEAGESRGNSYVNNKFRSCTADFNAIGKHRLNGNATGTPVRTLAATHLDYSTCSEDVILLDPGGAANLAFIDNGIQGERITIRFNRADTLVVNSANMLVAGSANVTPTANSVMTFICTLDTTQVTQIWLEESRAFR